MTEGEDATPISDKLRKSLEVVDKTPEGQRIKSDKEAVPLMELETIFFSPDCMTSSQSFSFKYVLNESCVCNPYVMTAWKNLSRSTSCLVRDNKKQ